MTIISNIIEHTEYYTKWPHEVSVYSMVIFNILWEVYIVIVDTYVREIYPININ